MVSNVATHAMDDSGADISCTIGQKFLQKYHLHQHDDPRHDKTRRLVVGRGGGAAAPTTTIPRFTSRRRPVVTTGHVQS